MKTDPIQKGPKKAPAGLADRSASGFMLFLMQSVIGKFINLAAQLILAYILVPEDFGLIGLAYTVMAFTSIFGVGGVREVLVQKSNRWNTWAWPGLLVACLFGLAATVLALGLAPLGVKFYGDPRLFWMVAILAASPLIQSLSVVPQARLEGQLRFRAAVVPGLLNVFLVPTLTVLFAAIGYGAYSFALPVPISAFAVSIVSWAIAGPMPRIRINLRRVKAMVISSGQLLGVSFAYQFINQIDYIVLGRIASTLVVGQYYFAFNLSTQSLRLVVGNFAQVLLPVVVKMSDDTERTRHAFIRACRSIALIGIPLSFAQAALARPAFEAFLESKWYPAIPILQVLSLGMGPRLLAGIADAVLKGRGRFGLLLIANWTAALILLGALLIAAAFNGSALSIAITTAIWSAAFGPVFVWIALREVGGGFRDLILILFGPLVVAVLGVGGAWMLQSLPAITSLNPILQLIIGVGASLVLTGIIASTLCITTIRDLKSLVMNRFRGSS